MSKFNFLMSKINYAKIAKDFDIVKVVNGNNKSMYYVSDYSYANSQSIAYETGSVMYILYEKGGYNEEVFSNEIGSKVFSHNLVSPKEIEKQVLIKLFMNRLNNFLDNRLSFNNLAGNLFFYDESTIRKKSFRAFKVEIKKEKHANDMLYINIAATKFVRTTREEMLMYKTYNTLYTFSDVEQKFLRKATDDENEGYINKGFKTNPTKSDFMVLPKKQDLENEEINTSHKVYYYHHTIALFNEMNSNYIQLAYMEAPSYKLDLKSPEKIDSVILSKAQKETLYFINMVGDDEITDKLVDNLCHIFSNVKYSDTPIKDKLNLILIHEPEYYEEGKDPHQNTDKSIPCQHIVYERLDTHTNDYNDKGELKIKPSLLTTLKELFIKRDIINQKITIEDWKKRPYICEFRFVALNNDKVYTMDIQPNGDLSFNNPVELSNSEYFEYFNNSSADYLMVSPAGDINTIKKTEGIVLPSEEALFTSSKTNLIKDSLYDGVFDLHAYKIDDTMYYSSGINNRNYQFDLKKAVHLYKIDNYKYKNMYQDLMNLCAVSFINQTGPSVIPYPFKYLREYINMLSNNSTNDCGI